MSWLISTSLLWQGWFVLLRQAQLVLAGGGGDLNHTGRGHLHVGLKGLLRAIEIALEKRGHLEALSGLRRRDAQGHVQGGHGRQV